jgi:uncharacterized protein with FMN-binding domain
MKTVIKRKGKIRMWIILLVILVVIAAGMGGAIYFTEPGRRELKNLTIDVMNFKKLRDGTYVGEYKGTIDSMRDAAVKVTVESGKVSDIVELKGALDKDGKPVKIIGGLSVDDLFGRVINSQSLQVDVISGATLTS